MLFNEYENKDRCGLPFDKIDGFTFYDSEQYKDILANTSNEGKVKLFCTHYKNKSKYLQYFQKNKSFKSLNTKDRNQMFLLLLFFLLVLLPSPVTHNRLEKPAPARRLKVCTMSQTNHVEDVQQRSLTQDKERQGGELANWASLASF